MCLLQPHQYIRLKDVIYLWIWDNIDESTHRLIGDDDDKYLYTPSEYALRILIYYDFVIIT